MFVFFRVCFLQKNGTTAEVWEKEGYNLLGSSTSKWGKWKKLRLI